MAPENRGDHERRRPGDVLAEVTGTCHQPFVLVAAAFEPLRRLDDPVDSGRQVQLGHPVLGLLIPDDHPATAAVVASGRCLFGHIDAVEDDLVIDVPVEVEALAYAPGRHQRVIHDRLIAGRARCESRHRHQQRG